MDTDAIGTRRVQGPLAFRWGSLLIHLQPVFAHALLIDTKVNWNLPSTAYVGAVSHLGSNTPSRRLGTSLAAP
jgi:hypothetical protein